MVIKTGIIVTWNGTIIVASKIVKSRSRPQNWKRAKTYAASEQVNNWPKVASRAILVLL
jgi:hypothetical protein